MDAELFGSTYSFLDTIWLILGAVLVFWMQAGFAMVETGFTRAKNAGNIIMKNLMDFVLGSIFFWIIGYGIMFGGSEGSFFGSIDFFSLGEYDTGSIPFWVHFMFNTVFCATAATIVSGAMAERTKFISYLIYSAVISAFIYPIEAHWTWGCGWLSTFSFGEWTGFTDYAGSCIVHMTGGVSAIIGAKILGPRIGKYTKDGKSKAIPGHSLTLGALGVFILWMGWFGFNPASSYGLSTDAQALDVANVFMTTNIAAATATLATMIFTWVRYGKPDVSMTLNGSLAGLVAITAGCSAVDPWAAAIIGLLAGVLVVVAIEFIDKVLKIDDPVGAAGVHGACGLFGTICVGLFGREGGLFTTGSFDRTVVQIVGVVATILFVGIAMVVVFMIIKATVGLRVTKEEEMVGLDALEHGLTSGSYADFMPTVNGTSFGASAPAAATSEKAVPSDVAVPVQVVTDQPAPAGDLKMSKVEIICKMDRFDLLKHELEHIGITGMTVVNVMGCGVQKGNSKFYRGVEVEVNLLPKIKVEVVVASVPVSDVIAAAKKALYTGNIGDGKIFVYGVDEVVKVRTGETDFAALQGEDQF